MRDVVKPLLLVLAVPVLATALSMVGQNGVEARWRANLVRQLAAQRMSPDDRLLASYSLPSLCRDPRMGDRLPPCRTYSRYSSVIRLSAVAAAAGFLFLGLLMAAGWLSRRHRSRFARMFRPCLVLAAGGTGVLALANAALALPVLVALEVYLLSSPFDEVPLSLLLMAMTAVGVWGVWMLAGALSVARRPSITLVARRLASGDHPHLEDEVRRAADAVGAQPPTELVVHLAPVMFVSELHVHCLDGLVKGRTLCVSLALSRILSVGEFRALLAHELAHFSAGDESYTRGVAPFFSGAGRSLDTLRRQARGIRRLVVVPPLELMTFFLHQVAGAGAADAGREFDADRSAARAFGAEDLGAALVKAQAFAPAWYSVAGAMFDAVSTGSQYVNAGQLFGEVVVSNTGPERLLGVGRHRLEHPTDQHPALSERLAALALDPSQVARAALVTSPRRPAVALIAGYEEIEQRLSASEHQLIAATGGEALERLPA